MVWLRDGKCECAKPRMEERDERNSSTWWMMPVSERDHKAYLYTNMVRYVSCLSTGRASVKDAAG